ncbi:unnamed protein product [Timema podura]|uniref:Uncharacterized protein n=1 Tax=Timema podura TaxID=61482 RepID=A0ABN7PKM0_TIMPD|nr:unnamed protein product [Timema podura]
MSNERGTSGKLTVSTTSQFWESSSSQSPTFSSRLSVLRPHPQRWSR